ncbi:MAG: AMP-binding protein [Syntrophobacterales bacterium]|nr:AMP-binding protein [Syntrophobacterales bacterium]
MLGRVDGLSGLTLGAILRYHALNYPHHLAVVDVDNNKRYTYEELNNRVNRLANSLLAMGIQKGDKVAILMKDRLEPLELMYALNKIGGIWAPVNYRLTPQGVKQQVLHSDAKMFFFEEEFANGIQEIKESLKIDNYVMLGEKERPGYAFYDALFEGFSEEEPEPEEAISSEDIIGIVYTSGTTGVSKGVMHTHRTFLGWAFNGMYRDATNRNDRLVNPYPMFHMGGSALSAICLLAGATNYIFGKFDPMKFIKVIEEEKITVVWAIPTIVHAVNNLAKEVKDKHKWASVRAFTTSGAPFLSETQIEFTKQWPHIKMHSTYSASEAYFTNLRPEDQDRKVRCVGPAVFGSEIRLMDKEGKDVPQGEVGIVYVQGISVFKGYYKNPEADKKSFRGDWFTCEDMGYLDEEGYLHLVDRAKDMIISGGENIASVEVENMLSDHPAIFECAVIGVPDDKWGERVHAVVSLHPGQQVKPEEIIDWCKDKIAGYKRPRSVDIIQELPKSPVGKLLKRELRDQYWKNNKVKV